MISIHRSIYQTMLAHVQALYPLEACGLLAGKADQIFHLYAVENILQSPIAYEMDGRQQLNAMLHAEKEGLELAAVYHSHPDGPALPSETDIAQAYYPDLIYLIISLQDRYKPVIRAFKIIDGRYEPYSLSIFG